MLIQVIGYTAVRWVVFYDPFNPATPSAMGAIFLGRTTFSSGVKHWKVPFLAGCPVALWVPFGIL